MKSSTSRGTDNCKGSKHRQRKRITGHSALRRRMFSATEVCAWMMMGLRQARKAMKVTEKAMKELKVKAMKMTKQAMKELRGMAMKKKGAVKAMKAVAVAMKAKFAKKARKRMRIVFINCICIILINMSTLNSTPTLYPTQYPSRIILCKRKAKS